MPRRWFSFSKIWALVRPHSCVATMFHLCFYQVSDRLW
jgi:hypothetical protein